MENAVVVDIVRSPMGRGRVGGALSALHPVELLAQVIKGLLDRTGIDPSLVDDVMIGCVSQSGEQAGCPGRMAWLAAGGPESVPAVTIDRRCGSSQQAVHFGAQAIMAGACDVVIVGGIESMSRVPMGSARGLSDPFGPSVASRYSPGLIPQGISAELMATKWNISRDDLDAFSVRSHARASRSANAGGFVDELIEVKSGGNLVEADETIRSDTTIERLATLKAIFQDDVWESRFPDLDWRITAGNSSQLADGAAAALLMSESLASRLGFDAMARLKSFAVCGDDPVLMLAGPIPATESILKRSGVDLAEIDHVEVNEAFASVPLAWLREFPIDPSKLNPKGGAIALGHPLGASGTRLLATLVHSMAGTEQRYGLQVMCELGGMANATLVENLSHKA